jgi:hypothetical protein
MLLLRRLLPVSCALAVPLAFASCGATPTAAVETRLLQVERVEVRIAESSPPQVTAEFRGILPDGCSSVGAISQERQGNTIVVTVTTLRTGEICTQAIQVVDQQVRLQGDFPAGTYVVRVNSMEARFTL